MANVYALKSGNWSDATVWNTGALPGTADDVYSNNFTVTIDQNISVNSINNASGTGITAGGGFTTIAVAAGNTLTVVVATNVVKRGGNAVLLTIPAMSGTVSMSGVTVQGAIGGIAGNTATVQVNGGTLNIGNVSYNPGTTSNTDGGQGALYVTAGTVNCGTVTAGSGSNQYGVLQSGGTLNCGNVSGGPIGNTYGIHINNGCHLNAGNINGGSGTSADGLRIDGGTANPIVVTANAAIANGANYGIYNVNCTQVNLVINGQVSAASNANGIRSDQPAVITVQGPMNHGDNNMNPIYANSFMVKAGQIIQWTVKDNSAAPNTGVGVTLSSANGSVVPATSDVRNGVNYGSNLVGTLKVPDPASVASGVPTDNTTGTATLDINQVSSVLGAQVAAALTS